MGKSKHVFDDGATVGMYRWCRTAPHAQLHPSRPTTQQYLHGTVSIILDGLDLDLPPPHVERGSEGQLLRSMEIFWLKRFAGGLVAADVSAQWETGLYSKRVICKEASWRLRLLGMATAIALYRELWRSCQRDIIKELTWTIYCDPSTWNCAAEVF